MDTAKKVIVGYDFCEDISQISCYSYKAQEPVPISIHEGDQEKGCLIPTVLCLKKDTKQWLFGEEAIAYASKEEGILVDRLLSRLQTGEEIEILQQTFTGVVLLEKFFRKTLTLVKHYFPTEPITKLVVTVPSVEPIIIDGIYEALSILGLDKDRAYVMSHAGAYQYYALSQDRTLWMNDVGLFNFSEQGLSFYQLHINRRTKPMIAGLTKQDFTDTLNYEMIMQKDIDSSYVFENIAGTALHKQIISTLYFTGKGFEGEWAENVIKRLCTGRRVFIGQNLFTKGACYAAKELSGDRKLEDILLLNDDMITTSLYIKVYCDTKFIEFPMAQVGENWYEVDKRIEVILENEAEFELIRKNIMSKDVLRDNITIANLPERPNRMTRLELQLTCKDKSTAVVTITDLGFGEIYPETGKLMECSIEI